MFIELLNRSRYMQYLATISATLSTTICAMYVTWASPTLPKLTSSNSPIGTTLTDMEASLVASAYVLGSVPGGMLSAWILSKVGPKTALLISVVPLFWPWLAIIYAKSALTLCIARFVAGIGGSIIYTAVPIYIGEVAEKDIRGRLGTAIITMYIVGSFFVLAVGPYVSYKFLAIISCPFPLIFGIIFWFMPESPYYLLKTNQTDAARINLIMLSARNSDKKVVQVHLDVIKKTIDYDAEHKSTLCELFTKVEYRRPLIIMIGIKIIQVYSGSIAIEAYLQTIVEASNSSISTELSSIIFGAIQIPAVLAAGALVDKIGRRPLLILSTLGCAVTLSAEGTYFYLLENLDDSSITDSLSWLPTVGLVLFLLTNTIGLGTLPFVLLGEIFPSNIKNHAVSLITVINGVLGFLVIIFFESVTTTWGIYCSFFTFSAIAGLGVFFILIVIPETKGKTFMEIQEQLNKK